MSSVRSILAGILPATAAIAVFGTLYGAAARPVMGVPLTLASSILIFSGSLQFAIVALATAGAAAPALLLTACTLNLRHLVMGAVLRPRIGGSPWRRAGLAFFLLDETFGFAVAAGDAAERAASSGGFTSTREAGGLGGAAQHPPAQEDGRPGGPAAERTLLVSGVACHLAWQTGTIVGLLGAGLPAIAGVAGAIFPVLFIGLASLACRTRGHALRALGAAGLTAGLAFALPDLRSLAPVVASVLVAFPGRDR